MIVKLTRRVKKIKGLPVSVFKNLFEYKYRSAINETFEIITNIINECAVHLLVINTLVILLRFHF